MTDALDDVLSICALSIFRLGWCVGVATRDRTVCFSCVLPHVLLMLKEVLPPWGGKGQNTVRRSVL